MAQLQATGVTGSLVTTGNVGIGTASPSQKLHIYGTNPTALIQDPSTGYAILQLDNASGGSFYAGVDNSAGTGFGSAYGRYLFSEGTYPMILVTNSTERIRILSDGNIGIGTTSPSSILQLLPGPAYATNASYQSFQAGSFGVLFRDAYDSYITFTTSYSP